MFIKIVISLVFVMLSMALYGGENCRTPLATKINYSAPAKTRHMHIFFQLIQGRLANGVY